MYVEEILQLSPVSNLVSPYSTQINMQRDFVSEGRDQCFVKAGFGTLNQKGVKNHFFFHNLAIGMQCRLKCIKTLNRCT